MIKFQPALRVRFGSTVDPAAPAADVIRKQLAAKQMQGITVTPVGRVVSVSFDDKDQQVWDMLLGQNVQNTAPDAHRYDDVIAELKQIPGMKDAPKPEDGIPLIFHHQGQEYEVAVSAAAQMSGFDDFGGGFGFDEPAGDSFQKS